VVGTIAELGEEVGGHVFELGKGDVLKADLGWQGGVLGGDLCLELKQIFIRGGQWHGLQGGAHHGDERLANGVVGDKPALLGLVKEDFLDEHLVLEALAFFLVEGAAESFFVVADLGLVRGCGEFYERLSGFGPEGVQPKQEGGDENEVE
jgi:hypothetical protein